MASSGATCKKDRPDRPRQQAEAERERERQGDRRPRPETITIRWSRPQKERRRGGEGEGEGGEWPQSQMFAHNSQGRARARLSRCRLSRMRVKMWHVFNFLPSLPPPLRHGLSVSSMRDTNSEDSDDDDNTVRSFLRSFFRSIQCATLQLAPLSVRVRSRPS